MKPNVGSVTLEKVYGNLPKVPAWWSKMMPHEWFGVCNRLHGKCESFDYFPFADFAQDG